jgi:hypothetical protein
VALNGHRCLFSVPVIRYDAAVVATGPELFDGRFNRCHCVCASAGETQPPSCSLAVFVVDTTEMELMISFGN